VGDAEGETGETGKTGKSDKTRSIVVTLVATVAVSAVLALFIYQKVTAETSRAAGDSGSTEMKARMDQRAQAATQARDGVTDLIASFARAVQARDFAAAQGLTSRVYRSGVRPSTFAAAVGSNPYLVAGGAANVRRTTMFDGTARIEGTFRSGAGTVTLAADFSEEPGGWKLSGLVLGGMPALPAPAAPR
jgi:hypothetical protein